MSIPASTQVLVIGGGPAGSTAASMLARQGFDVVLIEKEHFPRYHIGETLLVSVQPFIDLVGARARAEAMGFQKKVGVLWQWGGEEWTFDWRKLNCDHKNSFHVSRDKFDDMLLRNAEDNGVRVFEGTSITEVHFDGLRPVSADWRSEDTGETGQIAFRFVVDTSGRAGLLVNRYFKSRRFLKAFQNVAIWSYFADARRPDTGFEGPLTIVSVPNGWLWYIPIEENVTSVGFVCHVDYFKQRRSEVSLEEIYRENLAAAPILPGLMTEAREVAELRVETDYSYSADQLAGPGWYLAGDAGCFIDPLLSSGVHLAMHSGTLAAGSIASVLRGEVEEARAARFYHKVYRAHFVRWALMVSTFYDVNKQKETAFWRAQTVSVQDLHGGEWTELKPAFSALMSGLIDLRDAQDHELLDQTRSRVESLLTQIREDDPTPNNRYYQNGEERFDWGKNAANAVEGLYLSLAPLGLVDESTSTSAK